MSKFDRYSNGVDEFHWYREPPAPKSDTVSKPLVIAIFGAIAVVAVAVVMVVGSLSKGPAPLKVDLAAGNSPVTTTTAAPTVTPTTDATSNVPNFTPTTEPPAKSPVSVTPTTAPVTHVVTPVIPTKIVPVSPTTTPTTIATVKVMPNVVGMDVATAEARLAALGIGSGTSCDPITTGQTNADGSLIYATNDTTVHATSPAAGGTILPNHGADLETPSACTAANGY